MADPRGSVVRLITDNELILNIGSSQGVATHQVYKILDPATQNVVDPKTGKDLGSSERVKAEVAVTQVGDGLSLAEIIGARAIPGEAPSRLTSDVWPEGVAVGDPAEFTGLIALVLPRQISG